MSRAPAPSVLLLGVVLCVGVTGCSARREPVDPDGGTEQTDGGAVCSGLSCKVARCPAGQDTVVTGVVTAPNGLDPIRQAIIYVPQSGAPDGFPPQVACEVCDNPVGDRPVTQTLSNLDGTFALHGVPVTGSTPIVIQKGRWRKVVNLPVQRCQQQALTLDQGRLPRNQGEGHLPAMAVAVGDYDAIECVLQNIGIDGTEFTAPDGKGAVHLYDNETSGGIGAPGGVNVSSLVSDLNKMLRYNLIFLNCSDTGNSQDLLRDETVKKNMVAYVAQGGRLYVTDWSYDWIQQPPPFSPFICYNDDQACSVQTPHGFHAAASFGRGGDPSDFVATVDQTTDAGKSLADWLGRLPVPIADGKVPITDLLPDWVLMRQTADDMTRYPSITWLKGNVKGANRPMTVTYDYPVAPERACGKVLYSSYHTRGHGQHLVFPRYCSGGDMLPQEHVLEYLIFEISSCIGVPLG